MVKIYYFLSIKKTIKKIIRNCDICIRNKLNCYVFYKLIKLLDTFARAWKLIILNFIIELFLLTDLTISIKYNVILIITNKFIKYIYFLLWKITVTMKNVAYKFIRIIIANYEVPDEIILNKNKFFISKIWTMLLALFNVIWKLFILFHLQTNEQIEKIN